MKTRLVIFLLAMLVEMTASAKVLIIPKRGDGIWAQAAHKAGKMLNYIDPDGQQKSVAMEDLLQIVPSVRRGKQYAPAEIEKVLKAIDVVKTVRPRLRKQLDPLQDEWTALQKSSPKLGPAIRQLEETYSTSAKDLNAFRHVETQLGMMKYKDLVGKFKSEIEGLQANVRDDFFEVNLQRLKKMGTPRSVDGFKKMSKIADELAAIKLSDTQTAKVTALVKPAADQLYAQETQRAVKAFGDGKSIPGYLTSRTILLALQKYVARTAEQKQRIERNLDGIAARLQRVHPELSLQHKGFPLTRDDYKSLAVTKDYCSSTGLPAMSIEEIAFVFPETTPPALRPGVATPIQYRVVFNQLPPKAGQYGIIVVAVSDIGDSVSYVQALSGFRVSQGRASLTFRDNLAGIPQELLSEKQQAGQALTVYSLLAVLPPGSDKSDIKAWQPLSLAWPLNVKP